MSNRAEAIVTFLACAREGLACNPSLHRTYTCAEIGTLLRAARAPARCVTEPGWGADRARADLDKRARRALPSLQGGLHAATTLPGPARQRPAAPCSRSRQGRLSRLHLGHDRHAEMRHALRQHAARQRPRPGARLEPRPDTVLLSLSPLSHHIAWVGVGQWLLAGCRFVTNDPPRRHERRSTGSSRPAPPTSWACRPTPWTSWPSRRRAGIARLGERRACSTWRARRSRRRWRPRFVAQGIKPQNIYGMTENSSHQYTHPDDDTETSRRPPAAAAGPATRCACSMRPIATARWRVGEVGEIGGRGGALMLGYFDNQAATEASFNRDGWFLSGDLGVLDERGNLKVVGRLKDLIIRGGHNIYPAHIEALALRHAQVARVAAFRWRTSGWASASASPLPAASRRRAAGPPWPRGPLQVRHAGVLRAPRRVPADRQRQDPEARAGRDGQARRAGAGAGALSSQQKGPRDVG